MKIFCINNECQNRENGMCDDGNENVRQILHMVWDGWGSSFIFNEFIGYAPHNAHRYTVDGCCLSKG